MWAEGDNNVETVSTRCRSHVLANVWLGQIKSVIGDGRYIHSVPVSFSVASVVLMQLCNCSSATDAVMKDIGQLA